jgi:glycine/D-amino acid oxidase-like deaminating enzyme
MPQAQRLPVHRGPAGWNAILGPQSDPTPLESVRTADVVIIGGGFAGLSAARRLLQLDPTLDVVLLEAGLLGESSAGRNSGFMIDLPHELTSEDYAGGGDDHLLIALNRRAIEFGREAVGEFEIKPDYFDECGKVNGAATPKGNLHNESYAQHLAMLGEPCELLDAKGMRELTGSRHYTGGLYTPGTVMLQPAGYIRGFGEGLKRNIALHENSPVTGYMRAGGGWIVQTPKVKVTTQKIILATNGHLESFGHKRGRLMHVMLYASMSPELTDAQIRELGGASRWGITPSDPMGTSMRRIDGGQGGNRIVTRTCASFRPNMDVSSRSLIRASRVQQTKFDQRFPQFAGLKPEYSWAGHLCMSKNGVSVLQEVDENVYSACVQNGLGTARGTMTGIGAAELAMGHESKITRHFTAEAEPTKLPPEPFSSVGANAYLRWKEWRAGAE